MAHDPHIDRARIRMYCMKLDQAFQRPGLVFLIGETSHVVEGWASATPRIEFTAQIAEGNRRRFDRLVAETAVEEGVDILQRPAEHILAEGYRQRIRPVQFLMTSNGTGLTFCHFDPYSVVIGALANEEAMDTSFALPYVEHGWVDVQTLGTLLENLVATDAVRQDADRLRRRYDTLLKACTAG